jgi:transcriptional regulator with XRE-family HTH domain
VFPHAPRMPRSSEAKTMPLRQVFARNVRLMRISVGLSQERMAAEAGLDRTFVGTLERGERNISIDNIELIAKAIGLPAYELMHPEFPELRGLDTTLTRAPRTARPYTTPRQAKARR